MHDYNTSWGHRTSAQIKSVARSVQKRYRIRTERTALIANRYKDSGLSVG